MHRTDTSGLQAKFTIVRHIYRPPAVYALSGNGLSEDQQTFHIQLCGSSISPS